MTDFAYCPNCNIKTQVTDSRLREKFLYRRRGCPECSYKITTYEVSISDYQRLARTAHKIADQLHDTAKSITNLEGILDKT